MDNNLKKLFYSDPFYLDDYKLLFDNTYSVIGHPKLINDYNFIGHMCNDGSNKSNYNDYNLEITSKCNAIFSKNDLNDITITATRDILKDSEILVSYGYNYWYQRKYQYNYTNQIY